MPFIYGSSLSPFTGAILLLFPMVSLVVDRILSKVSYQSRPIVAAVLDLSYLLRFALLVSL